MVKEHSYCLKTFMVREYQGTKYLTMHKEGLEIIPTEDIGAVVDQGDRDDEMWVINDVTVQGVPYLAMYKSCLQCKARFEPHTECLGKYLKTVCIITQKDDLCPHHTTAKLLFLYNKGGEQKTGFAFAYGEIVHQIAGTDFFSCRVLWRC